MCRILAAESPTGDGIGLATGVNPWKRSANKTQESPQETARFKLNPDKPEWGMRNQNSWLSLFLYVYSICCALSGRDFVRVSFSQGFTLGWYVTPACCRQAFSRRCGFMFYYLTKIESKTKPLNS